MLLDPAIDGAVGTDVVADLFRLQPLVFYQLVPLREKFEISVRGRSRANDGSSQSMLCLGIQIPLLDVSRFFHTCSVCGSEQISHFPRPARGVAVDLFQPGHRPIQKLGHLLDRPVVADVRVFRNSIDVYVVVIMLKFVCGLI